MVEPFLISVVITLVSFFIVGVFKAGFTNQNRLIAGLETTLVGGVAAALAYTVGVLLSDLTL